MKASRFFLAAVIIVIGGFFVFLWFKPETSSVLENKDQESKEITVRTYSKSLIVEEGSTFGKLMAQASVTPELSQAIFAASREVYDLTNVRLGRTINLIYSQETNELKQLVYQIDSEEELFITLKTATGTATSTGNIWQAERKLIPYEIKIKTVEGKIENSMWESGLAKGIDERAIIAFADVFQWAVDFAWQVRTGDEYKFIFEERYLNGEYVMPGKILAGKFVNDGKDLYAFYYEESLEKIGYFDEAGNSVQKVFLKAPLAFKYISSGFTTGRRYISAFNMSTGHRAVDYAAAAGTPIRTVGDGTVVFAGWDGSYGRKVTIRHNSTYSTNYCHMSKIGVKTGQQVTQGQTIGYVGSTGLSTGPHLHYEMIKYGTKINPLAEELPSAEGIKEENKDSYLGAIKDWQTKLD